MPVTHGNPSNRISRAPRRTAANPTLGPDHPRIDSCNESNYGSRTNQWQISGKKPIMYPRAGVSGEIAIRVSPAP
jgi:hypothetical protein